METVVLQGVEYPRYAITIQNPMYSLEVFVWDRKAKQVLFSTQYSDLSVSGQAKAKQRCQKFLDDHLASTKGDDR